MRRILSAVACIALAFLTGCTSTKTSMASGRRFNENASTDVILQFSRWDTIYMIRPDTRVDGFLPILDREAVMRELHERHPGHALAAVVVPYGSSAEYDAQLFREWQSLLSAEGFKRVVLLRAGMGTSIDGLLVLHDSAIAAADEKASVAPTALAPAAGAHVAYPSGN